MEDCQVLQYRGSVRGSAGRWGADRVSFPVWAPSSMDKQATVLWYCSPFLELSPKLGQRFRAMKTAEQRDLTCTKHVKQTQAEYPLRQKDL